MSLDIQSLVSFTQLLEYFDELISRLYITTR